MNLQSNVIVGSERILNQPAIVGNLPGKFCRTNSRLACLHFKIKLNDQTLITLTSGNERYFMALFFQSIVQKNFIQFQSSSRHDENYE